MKQCTQCGETKSLEEYSPAESHRDGRRSNCKVCERERAALRYDPDRKREYNRQWQESNPDAHLHYRYGLTGVAYDELLAAQGGVCGVCGTDDPGGKGSFHVDHDHDCCPTTARSCGRCIRGLLCTGCNAHLERTYVEGHPLYGAVRRYLDAAQLRSVATGS